jgi:hypothetical protein
VERESKYEIAQAMQMRGMVVSLIADITGLPEDEILALQQAQDSSFVNN